MNAVRAGSQRDIGAIVHYQSGSVSFGSGDGCNSVFVKVQSRRMLVAKLDECCSTGAQQLDLIRV
jgi:hypothetical protein